MGPARSHGPFEMMGLWFLGEGRQAYEAKGRRNRVSGKIGDMSLFTAIEW